MRLINSGRVRPFIFAMLLAAACCTLFDLRPAQAQEGLTTVFLPAVMGETGGGQAATSAELIAAAVARGEISAETGLLYRIYADFGDPRLPAIYRGDDPAQFETDVLRQAAAQWNTLAPDVRAAILPFVTPPMYAGSWGDPARYAPGAAARAAADVPIPCQLGAQESLLPGWTRIEQGDFYIWYSLNGDPASNTDPAAVAAAAQMVAALVQQIYQQEHALIGRDLPSDAGEPCNGGDGKFDIYMTRVRANALALTVGYPPGCELRPSFMSVAPDVVNGDRAMAELLLAHEFMHTFQFGSYDYAGNCNDNTWVDEATASWAADYVFPANNKEHEMWAKKYLEELFAMPLDRGNGYSQYLFFFFLTRQNGNANLVPQFYAQLEHEPDVLTALDAVIPGGFDDSWPEFALYNWNRAPVDDYKQWDQLPYGAAAATRNAEGEPVDPLPVVLGDNGDDIISFHAEFLPHLTARYHHFTFPDDTVRSVTFYSGYAGQLTQQQIDLPGLPPPGSTLMYVAERPAENVGVKTWAIYRLEGKETWEAPEDWTATPARTFCRDVKTERIAELVVIESNSSPTENAFSPGFVSEMHVSNIGCHRWESQSTYTRVLPGPVTETFEATVTWERLQVTEDVNAMTVYVPVAGTGKWQIKSAGGSCVYAGDATFDLGPDDGELLIYDRLLDGDGYRGYGGRGQTEHEVTYTITCGEDVQVVQKGAGVWFEPPTGLEPEPFWKSVLDDGVTIDDSESRATDFGTVTISETRSLHAVRE